MRKPDTLGWVGKVWVQNIFINFIANWTILWRRKNLAAVFVFVFAFDDNDEDVGELKSSMLLSQAASAAVFVFFAVFVFVFDEDDDEVEEVNVIVTSSISSCGHLSALLLSQVQKIQLHDDVVDVADDGVNHVVDDD